jgi:hypothetical protein
MDNPPRYCEFVWLPTYESSAKGLLGDAEQRAIEAELAQTPERGKTVGGACGVRKLRVALPGRGKRGSAVLG